MSLKSRVTRLSQQRRPGLCPQCRDRRGRVLLVAGHKRRDGTFVADRPAPPPCPACGDTPEKLLVVVEELVGSDGSVLAWDDLASQPSAANDRGHELVP
jgi:hypothetical protein